MKLYFAGGLGEHGRNCFYVEGETCAFLVDCGILAGAVDPYPNLTNTQIQKADYLFLTHSHKDHTGALGWLKTHGFHGVIVTSHPTVPYLPQNGFEYQALEDYALPQKPCTFFSPLQLCWGRSGHCFGSVWLQFQFEGKTLLFSGDYYEGSRYFFCDKLRGKAADVAVIDHANGISTECTSQMRRRLIQKIGQLTRHGKSVMLPVPKNGRGTELLWILSQRLPRTTLYADAALCHAWSDAHSNEKNMWLVPYVVSYPAKAPCKEYLPGQPLPTGSVLLWTDAQLERAESRDTAEALLESGASLVMTGYLDIGSYSRSLYESGRVKQLLYPAHQGTAEFARVCRYNRFAHVFAVHSADFDHQAVYEF